MEVWHRWQSDSIERIIGFVQKNRRCPSNPLYTGVFITMFPYAFGNLGIWKYGASHVKNLWTYCHKFEITYLNCRQIDLCFDRMMYVCFNVSFLIVFPIQKTNKVYCPKCFFSDRRFKTYMCSIECHGTLCSHRCSTCFPYVFFRRESCSLEFVRRFFQ